MITRPWQGLAKARKGVRKQGEQSGARL